MKTFFLFALLVLVEQVNGAPLGDRFMDIDPNRSKEEFVTIATSSGDGLRISMDEYRELFYNEGFPAGSIGEFGRYLMSLDARQCKWKLGEVEVAYLHRSKEGNKVNFFKRRPYAGERCLYDGSRAVVSIYCGNIIRQNGVPMTTTTSAEIRSVGGYMPPPMARPCFECGLSAPSGSWEHDANRIVEAIASGSGYAIAGYFIGRGIKKRKANVHRSNNTTVVNNNRYIRPSPVLPTPGPGGGGPVLPTP